MTTAFVLSGGGSLGAVQVGMLQALAARGVEPDLVIGTSAAAAVGRVPSLCPNDALRQLVEQHLGFARLEDAAQRLVLEVADHAGTTDLRVLPPLCPLSVSSTDFRHASLLVERSRTATQRWLDDGGPHRSHPERFLALHRHTFHAHDRHGSDPV